MSDDDGLDLATAAEALEAEGYDAKVWEDRRIYIKQRGRDLGYITEGDLSGGTGTCKNVQRSGHIARILRNAQT